MAQFWACVSLSSWSYLLPIVVAFSVTWPQCKWPVTVFRLQWRWSYSSECWGFWICTTGEKAQRISGGDNRWPKMYRRVVSTTALHALTLVFKCIYIIYEMHDFLLPVCFWSLCWFWYLMKWCILGSSTDVLFSVQSCVDSGILSEVQAEELSSPYEVRYYML